MRIHTSPSIQITEIDKSQYSPAMVGTKVLIPGFTSKGEAYKPTDVTSRTAWINIFGEPTTEAERYSYAAVCEALNNNGKVCFTRLPYDNASFEKLVALKYNVSVKNKDYLVTDGPYHKIYELDNEIKDVSIIKAANPLTVDLAQVDEYRTDEAKVPADTFLIVDTTGGTYAKVTEDYRKKDKREVIGIVPVVTTAANALLAQALIDCELNEISAYEVLGGTVLNTLSDVNDGLSCTDLAKRLNTQGYFGLQKYDFTPKTIVTAKHIDLGDRIGTMYNEITAFIKRFKLEDYDVTTLAGMKVFANDINDGILPYVITDEDIVKKLRDYAEEIMNVMVEGQWFYLDEEGNEGEQVEWTIEELTDKYAEFADGNRLMFADGPYVNPDTIKQQFDEEGKFVRFYATMMYAEEKDSPEWHGINGDDSIPETLALDANNFFSAIHPGIDGEGLDPENLKDIGIIVYQMYLDPSEGNKVSYNPVEAFCGSLYKDDKNPNTGVTKFIDTIVNSQSQYINIFSNCFNSIASKKYYLEECDILIAEPSNGASLGLYESMTVKDISINKSIYDGLNKAFDKVSDINKRDIDIVCDAGVANIASYLKAIYGNKGQYDLMVTDDIGNSLLGLWKAIKATDASVKTWKTVELKFDNFCKNVRKDCMFIADGLRPLVLQGQKKIIRDSKPTNTIDANILPYINAVAGLNTSYGAGYLDWFEQADDYTGDFFWCPPSIKAMGVYINTDVNFNYWDAPAGLNRGIVPCLDCAFSPTASQADIIYDKSWNYAVNYPNDGICLEGQKTFQVKPSALDRVNVRRLLLRLERAAYQVSRYFLYEGNTAYTRQRLVDALDPYFRSCKAGGGCYDYKIVCDESNNTPDTIDQNELHVSIGIKPVKAIEYIMIDFIVGRTGSSWEELGL